MDGVQFESEVYDEKTGACGPVWETSGQVWWKLKLGKYNWNSSQSWNLEISFGLIKIKKRIDLAKLYHKNTSLPINIFVFIAKISMET